MNVPIRHYSDLVHAMLNGADKCLAEGDIEGAQGYIQHARVQLDYTMKAIDIKAKEELTI